MVRHGFRLGGIVNLVKMEVELPFIDGAFPLYLDKEVNGIPIDFNGDHLTANGVVKWLGKLPVSNSITFAGLEMVSTQLKVF